MQMKLNANKRKKKQQQQEREQKKIGINRNSSERTYNQHEMTMKKSLLVRKSPLARDSSH